MENFNRDKHAEDLNNARNLGKKGKELAQDLKKEVARTEEYKTVKELHIQDNIDQKNPDSQRNIKVRAESIRDEINSLKKEEKIKEVIEKFGFEPGSIIEGKSMAGDNEAIEKLNKTLKPGEKPWRMISKEDLEHALRRCIELSADGKEEDAKKLAWEIGGELGFKKGEYYRTSTIYNEHGYSYCHYFPFSFSEGHFQISGEADSSRIFKVKLVR